MKKQKKPILILAAVAATACMLAAVPAEAGISANSPVIPQPTARPVNYIVDFMDDDGNFLDSKICVYGERLKDIPAPEDKEDASYFYRFVGWEPQLCGIVTDCVLYTAVYQKIPKPSPGVYAENTAAPDPILQEIPTEPPTMALPGGKSQQAGTEQVASISYETISFHVETPMAKPEPTIYMEETPRPSVAATVSPAPVSPGTGKEERIWAADTTSAANQTCPAAMVKDAKSIEELNNGIPPWALFPTEMPNIPATGENCGIPAQANALVDTETIGTMEPVSCTIQGKKQEVTSKETGLKEPASKESASKETASKETASKETASEEGASKKTASKETASEETASEEGAGKEAGSQDVGNKEAGNKEAEGKEAGSKKAGEGVETDGEYPIDSMPMKNNFQTAGTEIPDRPQPSITGQEKAERVSHTQFSLPIFLAGMFSCCGAVWMKKRKP